MLPVFIFWAAREGFGLESSEAHYVVFPLLASVIFSLVGGARFGAFLGAIFVIPVVFLGSRYAFSFSVTSSSSDVILTRFNRDSEETETSVLREQIYRFLEKADHKRVRRSYQSVESHSSARDAFPNAPIVVWGKNERVGVSFQKSEFPFESVPVFLGKQARTLQVISTIPGFQVSLQPVNQTGEFLAHILKAELLEQATPDWRNSGEQLQSIEEALLSGSAIRALWTSNGHLAYPLWKLGNIALLDFGRLGMPHGELVCANRQYSAAASKLQPKDNPPLRAAIFNNKAVVSLLLATNGQRSDVERRKGIRTARELFKKADAISEKKSAWTPKRYITKVVRRNLRILKNLTSQYHKRKKAIKRKSD
ncbi:MAG: hypothetical protein KDD60_04780 [Bdellovibrionales bacterium]|nr:hypothetical protein [Bdellovibrionales bacterium]